ncbi:MAG: hypothetical protein IJ501_06645 [Bacilli bacterium]|nr:hypothetical protein [Bacilli bacterium]
MNMEDTEIQIISSKSALDLSEIFENSNNIEGFKENVKEIEELKDSDIK